MKRVVYALACIFLVTSNIAISQTRIAGLMGDTINVNLSNARGIIQWQRSMDSLNWENIAGQTSASLNYLPNASSQWVRAAINETNCPEFYEHPIHISVVDTSIASFESVIVVLDTVNIVFQPDSLQQELGFYQFTCPQSISPLDPGDIIIGTQGEGFLRFVDETILQNGILVVHTSQASLDDVFGDAEFSFAISNDSLDMRTSGFNYVFDQTTLYQDGPVTLNLTSGNVGITGSWDGTLSYSLFNGLQNFYFGTNDLNLDINFSLDLQATQEVNLLSGSKNLASYSRYLVFAVGGVPVVISLSADLIAQYELDLNAQVHMESSLSTTVALQTQLNYTNGEWNNTFEVTPSTEFEFSTPEGQVQAVLKLGLIPEFKMKIYGVVVPYLKPSAHLDITGTVSSPDLNWDVKGIGYSGLQYGLEDIVILGHTVATFQPNVFESEHLDLYNSPDTLILVSGQGQSGMPNTPLNNPIVVRVMDSFGLTQQNVPVHVDVTSGNGTIWTQDMLTDTTGEAQINWVLGSDISQPQLLSIHVRNGLNEEINGSPISVFAGCMPSTDFITDSEGNQYPVIQIGSQRWMAKNLTCSHFADSTEIPQVQDSNTWIQLSTPGWCIYENNALNDTIYGKLYNWYTVMDARGVCPTGWHVPSSSDWMVLSNYLGGDTSSGGKMKCLEGWQFPNMDATNVSGFSALPGGARGNTGSFGLLGSGGAWWSSSENTPGYDATGYFLFYNTGSLMYEGDMLIDGLAVRCVED